MKTLSSLLLLFSGLFCFGQQTITSVANGNANNPFTWDCTCFPATSDNIIINHDIVMNVDWLVNGGGSITVNSSGSFIQDAQHRSILIDGANSEFNNLGQTTLTNLAFTNGGAGDNLGVLSLDTGLWVGTGSSFSNSGTTSDLDSTFIQGTFTNSGSFSQGDFWNDGTVTNSGNITADSLLNTGTFNSSGGIITATDFANDDVFSISGTSYMDVSNNFFNLGDITVAAGRDINVGNDFWTGDTLGGNATIDNDGFIVVGNDFTNTNDLSGDGVFCIANSSANAGDVSGLLDICDNTGSGYFDINTGTIGVTVTDCISGCFVSGPAYPVFVFEMYPNPTKSILNIKHQGIASIEIVDISGKTVYYNNSDITRIDISGLSEGVYFVKVSDGRHMSTKKLIKQ